MTADKLRYYHAEAERCAHLAAQESCDDAREYYQALSRDYLKLAARAAPTGADAPVG